MARILIPTDFSDSSMRAGEFAVKLLGQKDHTYILLHAYYDLSLSDPMVPALSQALLTSSEEGLKHFAEQFVGRTGARQVEQEVVFGTLPSAANAQVRKAGAQLVVMGKRGKSSTPLFGSNTIAMIGHSRVPVLVVPETAVLKKVERILLADDYAEVLAQDLVVLRDIALANGAEVLIGHVNMGPGGSEAHWSNSVYELALKDVLHSFHLAYGSDVLDGIDRFARHKSVDMIAVLHRHIGLIGRLLHPSMTKELARDTELPLLVLEGVDD